MNTEINKILPQKREGWENPSRKRLRMQSIGKSSVLYVELSSFCSLVRFTVLEMWSHRLDDFRLVRKSCGPGDGVERPRNLYPVTGLFPCTHGHPFFCQISNESIANSKIKLMRGRHNIAMTLSMHATPPSLSEALLWKVPSCCFPMNSARAA